MFVNIYHGEVLYKFNAEHIIRLKRTIHKKGSSIISREYSVNIVLSNGEQFDLVVSQSDWLTIERAMESNS